MGDAGSGSGGRGRIVIAADTSVLVRYLVGSPPDQARAAAALIDDGIEAIGVSPVALAECAQVLRTQYEVSGRDIIDGLIALVQRENVRVLGLRADAMVEMLVRARSMPGRPIPDAMIVASAMASDAATLATFDLGQARYGFPVAIPSGAGRERPL
jgi:predicted nucleic acid-binding protein